MALANVQANAIQIIKIMTSPKLKFRDVIISFKNLNKTELDAC